MVSRTSGRASELRPSISILIPASNEEAMIGRCLACVAQSVWTLPESFETIVISNGSRDNTTEAALAMRDVFAARGLELNVIERKEGGKPGALNAGDKVARGHIRVYLDADVEISANVLRDLHAVLDTPEPRYASGRLVLGKPATWVTRAYGRIYAQVPFLKHGVPGAGLFAVNATGRMRWDQFPDIISDDTFVRLSFRPEERIGVPAPYTWPLVEGWKNLVRVRRRQNSGVDEIRACFPDLMANDDKPEFPFSQKARLALQDPVGFAVYAGVALAVRFMRSRTNEWSRGR